MRTRELLLAATVLFVASAWLNAEQPRKTVVKHTRMAYTSPASGKEMYRSYCASCHGVNGKGTGPASQALKVPPPDLTLLSKTNSGKYPSLRVKTAIHGDTNLPSHGSKDMPVWGELFWRLGCGDQSQVQLRINNLNRYVESLQVQEPALSPPARTKEPS